MSFFVTFETFSCFLLFLLPTFLGYIVILVTVKVFWLSILEIVVGLSNVHGLSSPSICYSCICFIIMSSFHRLILLSYWGDYHLPFFKHFWCCNERILLWQPLDQCLMKPQIVNLTGGISSRNTSCVFTRELNRESQQYFTNYLYKCPWSMLRLLYAYPNVYALSSYLLVICLISYYSSTMYLLQGQHAVYMCPDIIPSTLLLISVIYACTMCTLWETMSLDVTPTLDSSWSF